jgi:hypothetical protein
MKINKLNLRQPPASQERSATSLARHSKRRGELGEAAFLAKAASMGIGVAKPWGDSERYDFIIDAGGRLLKVQIKSAHCISAARSGGYHIRAQPRQKVSYRPDEIDLLVAYIVPLDIWYIFPPEAFVNMTSVHLFPNSDQRRSRFEQYREAWEWVYRAAEFVSTSADECSQPRSGERLQPRVRRAGFAPHPG